MTGYPFYDSVSAMAKKRKGSTKATGRDYSYDKAYAARPEQRKRRAERNAARAKAMKRGTVKKGDGKDVHHVDSPRNGTLTKSKTMVISASSNRAMKRNRKK